MVKKIRLLWVDDEIDLLKPHIFFLRDRGYEVQTATNGEDAIQLVKEHDFALVFLDENMPGMSGIEILSVIKAESPGLPVVMITKSEEEDIMDAAIGSKINDYLIKPVKPQQVLLTIKKNLDINRLITQETTSRYQTEFGKIGLEIMNAHSFEDWTSIYKELVYWDIQLQGSEDKNLDEILRMQKMEANKSFGRYIKSNYLSWLEGNDEDKPLMSPNIMKEKVFPWLKENEKTVFLVIDNLRFDQWKLFQEQIRDYFSISKEDLYLSILPSATQYARNSLFAGLMPLEISKLLPQFWVDELSDESKNNFEKELLEKQLSRQGLDVSMTYNKILNNRESKKILENFKDLLKNDLNVLVFNFVDLLSHARTDMEMIKALTVNDSAYRSISQSWFKHSDLLEILKILSAEKVRVVLTTDHGTIQVNNPIKVVGDKQSSVNLRYKQGKNLNYKNSDVFAVKDPERAHLPKNNISSSYIFAMQNDYMVYPNNFNYFANFYKNSYQHGGISLEEMLIPIVTLEPK